MSISIMAEVWKSSLPMTEKMVLLCLADFANDRGECWPSVDKIADKCSCSDRTVQKAIKALRELGVITTRDAPGRPHMFVINPRNIFTPEESSPPKNTTKGVKNIRPGGEARSPEPSKNHQEPSKGSPPDGERPLTQTEVIEGWNHLADQIGLPKIVALSPERKRKLATRIKHHPPGDWLTAFDAIRRSAFLRGENPRGWRANFDFLLQPSSFIKLIEGQYDQQPVH